jgi:hypothetical protein
VDLNLVGSAASALDELGELVDAGLGLFAGVVPSTGLTRRAPGATQPDQSPAPDRGAPSAVAAADAVTGVWHRLGFPQERAATQVVVTPTCGLARATPRYARAALAACVEAARRLEPV